MLLRSFGSLLTKSNQIFREGTDLFVDGIFEYFPRVQCPNWSWRECSCKRGNAQRARRRRGRYLSIPGSLMPVSVIRVRSQAECMELFFLTVSATIAAYVAD
jgi:hypothetical protein